MLVTNINNFKLCFTAHAYFNPELMMVPYGLRISQQYYVDFHWNASAPAYRVLSTCVMWSVKAVCQEMPETNSGENIIFLKTL